MLELRHISKSFGAHRVLSDICLKLNPGETVFVLGRSGVGKSVLLKTIVGLVQQDSGEVWVKGERTEPDNEAKMVKVRRQCGLVFQNPALLDSLTVEENLLFADGTKKGELKESLSWLKLPADILDQYPSQLSFGLQKKVSLLRTLLSSPEYLLFDEPTTGLDPITTQLVNELIQSCAKERKAGCLIVSHDLNSAYALADKILLIDKGEFIFQGKPHLFRVSELPLAAAFRKGTVTLGHTL